MERSQRRRSLKARVPQCAGRRTRSPPANHAILEREALHTLPEGKTPAHHYQGDPRAPYRPAVAHASLSQKAGVLSWGRLPEFESEAASGVNISIEMQIRRHDIIPQAAPARLFSRREMLTDFLWQLTRPSSTQHATLTAAPPAQVAWRRGLFRGNPSRSMPTARPWTPKSA